VNRTRTVERGASNAGVRATRTRARNQIIIEGTLPLGGEEVFVGRYSVENPSRYAAHLFRQALQAAGVVVERGIAPALTPSPSPTGWERGVGAHGSAPYRSSSPALRERGIIPIAETYSTKTQAIEDPLLKVPPASRGNRTDARFPSRSGGNLKEGGIPEMTLLAEHLSPPLREVVALINKPSDNLITEITLKTLGKEVRGEGTTAAGVQVLREFLQSAGLEMGAVHIVDGSGLSRINGVSAENFVRLLEYMHRSPHAEAFRDSLPVYGVDGTLRNRLRGTPVQGNGYAKTGSLNRVSSVSGYLRTKSGRWLAFSIIMNAYNAAGSDARALQDQARADCCGSGCSFWVHIHGNSGCWNPRRKVPLHAGEPAARSTVSLAKRRESAPHSVPVASGGNRTPARFPSRSGGNLKEGGNITLFHHHLREVRQREVEPIRARQQVQAVLPSRGVVGHHHHAVKQRVHCRRQRV
jgi:hypothetical protein